jgi:hypothetical protein
LSAKERQIASLRAIADELEAEGTEEGEGDPYEAHPDTLRIIESRGTKRGQFNYSVPLELDLQRRIRRYHVEHGTQHGDVVALALDSWLRAQGFPPPLPNPSPAKGEK